jgi:hypothetical protein
MVHPIRWTVKCVAWIVLLGLLFLFCFLSLCTNWLTIPVHLLAWVVCRLVKRTPPHLTRYCLTFYPTWSNAPHKTFTDTLREIDRDSAKMAKARSRRFRPYETWFFD